MPRKLGTSASVLERGLSRRGQEGDGGSAVLGSRGGRGGAAVRPELWGSAGTRPALAGSARGGTTSSSTWSNNPYSLKYFVSFLYIFLYENLKYCSTMELKQKHHSFLSCNKTYHGVINFQNSLHRFSAKKKTQQTTIPKKSKEANQPKPNN